MKSILHEHSRSCNMVGFFVPIVWRIVTKFSSTHFTNVDSAFVFCLCVIVKSPSCWVVCVAFFTCKHSVPFIHAPWCVLSQSMWIEKAFLAFWTLKFVSMFGANVSVQSVFGTKCIATFLARMLFSSQMYVFFMVQTTSFCGKLFTSECARDWNHFLHCVFWFQMKV